MFKHHCVTTESISDSITHATPYTYTWLCVQSCDVANSDFLSYYYKWTLRALEKANPVIMGSLNHKLNCWMQPDQ